MTTAVPHKINDENRNEWDSAGMELISRMFNHAEKTEAFEEIENYTIALKGKDMDNWAAFDSVSAGTHIHIGLNIANSEAVNDKPTIIVLQHLTYILVAYEDLMSQLHPKHRSGEVRPMDELDTPRLPEESEIEQAERTLNTLVESHTGYPELRSNARHLAKKVKPSGRPEWVDIRNAIFPNCKMKIYKLVDLLQEKHPNNDVHRGYIVNWGNLNDFYWDYDGKQLKPTIEFRQHASSLSAEEMKHWMDLLFAIFEAAEVKSKQKATLDGSPLDTEASFAAQEGSKYAISCEWKRPTVREFCGAGLLDLDEEEIVYWESGYDSGRTMKELPWE